MALDGFANTDNQSKILSRAVDTQETALLHALQIAVNNALYWQNRALKAEGNVLNVIKAECEKHISKNHDCEGCAFHVTEGCFLGMNPELPCNWELEENKGGKQ